MKRNRIVLDKNQIDVFALPDGLKFKQWTRVQRGDYILSFVALSQIFLGLVQFLFIAFGMSPIESTQYRVIMSALTIMTSIPVLLKRNIKLFLMTYFVMIFIYMMHAILFPATIEYWNNDGLRFLFPISIPIVLCVVSIRDRRFFYLGLSHISYACAFLCLIFGYRTFSGSFILSQYSMGFGYFLLLPMLVLFYQRKIYSIAIAIILFLLLVLYGSRGPLLTVAVFLIYMLIERRSFILIGLLAIIAVAGFASFVSFIESSDMSSRTVSMFMSGNLAAETNRDIIAQKAIKLIQDNLITGCGIFGDRRPVGDWCHNLFLEIFCDYGVFLGSAILFLFFYMMINAFIKLKGSDKDIFAMLIAFAVVPMMVSSSYLTDSHFALFLGFMFYLYKSRPWTMYNFSLVNKKLIK